jgi:uncharacterized membrane protein
MRLGIRRTLQVGVGVSCVLLLVGMGIAVASGDGSIHASAQRASFGSLAAELAAGQAQGFLLLGVAVLVFTPLVRVLLSLGTFARAEDIPFSLITLFVIIILCVGLVFGLVP